MAEFLVVVLFSFFSSLILVPAANLLGKKFDIVDRPGERKVHLGVISRTGGFVLFLISALTVTFLWCQHYGGPGDGESHHLFYLIPAVFLIGILGVIDDSRGADVWTKLFYQGVAAVLVMKGGIVIDRVMIPFDGSVSLGFFAYPLTLFFIVGITNAYNLIDGMDGLACGVGGTVAAATSVVGIVNGNLAAASICGSLAVFLGTFYFFNRHPAKIFLGDTGSLLLGFLISVVSLECFRVEGGSINFSAVVIVNGLVIWDTSLVFFRRLFHGKSPFTPDRDHVHHRILRRLGSVRSAGRSLLLVNIVFILAGVSLLSRELVESFSGFITLSILVTLALSKKARLILSAFLGMERGNHPPS